MLYFIPAWYRQGQWRENEQNWYEVREHTEFDDTVKQVQLFHRNRIAPYRIMLLGHAPNFRHFLHRQSVYHASYWSCFDAIQEVKREKVRLFSFHDLSWPDDIAFVYTEFAIIAMHNKQKYAQLEIGEDGNLIRLEMFAQGKRIRKNIYDDRGFVSVSILYDEQEKPIYEDYLMENGIRKLRRFYEDGHVEVNPKYPQYRLFYDKQEHIFDFRKLEYDCLEDVIREVLEAYIKLTDQKDVFCVAMHRQHMNLLEGVLKGKKTVLSFFQNRMEEQDLQTKACVRMVRDADYIVVDSQENLKLLKNRLGENFDRIKEITPFDTRVDFGISQQLSVQKILLPVDGLDETLLRSALRELADYLVQNQNAQVHLFSRKAESGLESGLLAQVRQVLKESGHPLEWAIPEESRKVSENLLEETNMIPMRFVVESCVDELSVSRCMREQRIIVDLRDKEDLYMQIMAVSVGIPQIGTRRTQYLVDGDNGKIIKDVSDLCGALDYYLNGLTHWNEAMICCYEIGKRYTTQVLMEKWKEVIDKVG